MEHTAQKFTRHGTPAAKQLQVRFGLNSSLEELRTGGGGQELPPWDSQGDEPDAKCCLLIDSPRSKEDWEYVLPRLGRSKGFLSPLNAPLGYPILPQLMGTSDSGRTEYAQVIQPVI